jgi:hypothetical protein
MFHQVEVNDRLLRRTQPYRNERIINVIHSVYFTGGASSFMRRFDHLFPRYRDGEGVMIPKVPDAMVALAATAVSTSMSYASTTLLTCSVATVKTSTFEKCVITGAINYVKS